MRVLARLSDDRILQAEPTPEVGTLTPINGKYVIPTVEGSRPITLNATDTVSSVTGKVEAAALAAYPFYDGMVYEGVLTGALFDAAFSTFTDDTGTYAARGQYATMPGSTAALPATGGIPGLLVTDNYDLTDIPYSLTGPPSSLLPWFKLYWVSTTHDVITPGVNTPAIKQLEEIDPNMDPDVSAWISTDNGVVWQRANNLRRTVGCGGAPINNGTDIRLAFKNTNTARKLVVAAYGIFYAVG